MKAAERALADRYFFETVVRVHRAGEGAPFTGLKPYAHAYIEFVEYVERLRCGPLKNKGAAPRGRRAFIRLDMRAVVI